MEQVANLTTKLNAKDEEIKALQCSIEDLTNTVRIFTMANMMQPQPAFNPNMMQNQMQPQQAFNPNAFIPQQQQSTPNSVTYAGPQGGEVAIAAMDKMVARAEDAPATDSNSCTIVGPVLCV
eukprot:10821146-Ditylum_brightwellii.AAC.1